MRRALLAGAALLVAAIGCQKKEQGAALPGESTPHPDVVLETTRGRIVLELDRNAAPKTVENIVAHVEQHFYDGLTFHRVIEHFVIQAGIQTADGRQRLSSAPPVPNEAANGLTNVRGSVALARTMDPQSGGVQFFINLSDNPRLNFRDKTVEGWGYCVFGRVKEGMDVAEGIGKVRTRPDDTPVEPVVIRRAYVAAATAPAKGNATP